MQALKKNLILSVKIKSGKKNYLEGYGIKGYITISRYYMILGWDGDV